MSGTTLAASRILTGPASQNIMFWSASIGLPARLPLIRPATQRFKVRTDSNHLPGLNHGARRQREEPNRPDGTEATKYIYRCCNLKKTINPLNQTVPANQ